MPYFKINNKISLDDKWVIPLLVVFALLTCWPWYFLLQEKGIIDKLSHFVFQKLPFYVCSLVALRTIYWFKKKYYNHHFSLSEYVIIIPLVLFANFGYIAIFFFWSTNLYDTEIWNGHVTLAEYYEEWTEEEIVCTTDDDGNTDCTTSYTHHSPYWQITTNNKEVVSISQSTYRQYNNLFRNQKFTNIYRPNQISIGDGNKYSCMFNGNKNKLVPTSISHVYVNFIKAAEPVFLYTGYASNYAKDLVSYPSVYTDKFGPIYLNRVIAPKVSITPSWSEKLNKTLANDLAYSGKEKQVNALVFISPKDTNIYKALHELWYGGKKNDVIVVIGSYDFPKISWVKIMSWTDSKRFKQELRAKILALEDIEDPEKLGTTISTQINLPESDGGFVRKPMAAFNELRDDIHLPFLAYLLVILLTIIIQIPVILVFLIVDIRYDIIENRVKKEKPITEEKPPNSSPKV